MEAETPIKIVSESPAVFAVSPVVSVVVSDDADVSFVSAAPDEFELHPASNDTI